MHNHRYRQFGMKDGKFSPHNRTLWSMKKPRRHAFVFCWVFSVCALGFSSGSRFEQTSARIRLPDDCTVGFIVEKRLGVSMVHCPLFHSHLENLLLVSQRSIPNQVVTHRTHTHWRPHRYASSSYVCVFSTAGDSELWDVWEQDEQHRGERKLLEGGRPLQVCPPSHECGDISHIILRSVFDNCCFGCLHRYVAAITCLPPCGLLNYLEFM